MRDPGWLCSNLLRSSRSYFLILMHWLGTTSDHLHLKSLREWQVEDPIDSSHQKLGRCSDLWVMIASHVDPTINEVQYDVLWGSPFTRTRVIIIYIWKMFFKHLRLKHFPSLCFATFSQDVSAYFTKKNISANWFIPPYLSCVSNASTGVHVICTPSVRTLNVSVDIRSLQCHGPTPLRRLGPAVLVEGSWSYEIQNEDVSTPITFKKLRTNLNLEIQNGEFEPKTFSAFLGHTPFWNTPASKTWSRNSDVSWKHDESLDHFCSCNLINLGRKQIRNMQLEKFERKGHVGAGCILSLLSSVCSAISQFRMEVMIAVH